MELKVKGKEYKVRFGYNSFCDTDLMDRTKDLLGIWLKERGSCKWVSFYVKKLGGVIWHLR